MKRTASVLLALVSLASPPAQAEPSGLRVARVTAFPFATGMAFTSDGRQMFVNERAGRVRVFTRGVLQPEPVATIPTTEEAEGGLLGLTLDPRFQKGSPFLYVFATSPDGVSDRVLRLRVEKDRAVETKEIFGGMQGHGYHHGGIVLFGHDGKLYVSNGEWHQQSRAQDPNILGGKIYRLNSDGSIPSDNPFPHSPTFSYGHRNPFGLCLHPQNGSIWETENGPDDHDEVNVLERGKNYGWPVVRGRGGTNRGFVDPVVDYARIVVPTMCAFGGDALPAGYRGNMFHGTFKEHSVRRLVLTPDRRGIARNEILWSGSAVVGMTMGPDGLYFSTPDALYRISAERSSTPSSGSASRASNTVPSSPSKRLPPSPSSLPLLVLAMVIGLGLGATLFSMWTRRRP